MITEEFNNYTIFIGKNKNENDQLITAANPDDFWIHLSDFPSGHAIIKGKKSKIPRKVLKRACILIKQNSKYKSEKNLCFDITQVKHLEKTTVIVNHVKCQITI